MRQKTREEREAELLAMLRTAEGTKTVQALYDRYAGDNPAPGGLTITTILKHEFPNG